MWGLEAHSPKACETGFIVLFILVSVYKVPFSYWRVYTIVQTLGVLLGKQGMWQQREHSLSQGLNFKLFGLYYSVGMVKINLVFPLVIGEVSQSSLVRKLFSGVCLHVPLLAEILGVTWMELNSGG